MQHTYKLTGMTCSGCEATVSTKLLALPEISAVNVSKDAQTATITMDSHVPIDVMQNALGGAAGRYQIAQFGAPSCNCASSETDHHRKTAEADIAVDSTFYCPMYCEGDKLYDKAGSCPLCGMNLEVVPTTQRRTKYTCPMHPEVVSDAAGSCPICGMDLVALSVSEPEDNHYRKLRNQFIVAAGFTIPVFIIAMADMLPHKFLLDLLPMAVWNWIQFLLTIPVIFVTWMFFERAWTSVKTRNLNMFTLIGLGTGVAILFSIIALLFPNIFPADFKTEMGTVHVYFEAAAVILTLVLLGQLLEARAHSRTNSAIRALLQLVPANANLIEDGVERIIEVDDIKKGHMLRVKPGDKIPVDGQIAKGETNIDESMITGEPMPVAKSIGDTVTAGTINGTGSFVMEAQKVGADTLLSQIIKMVNEASRSKAPIQKTVDRIARYFVPIVIGISLMTFIAWYILGSDRSLVFAMTNAIAVLIIACPCALGLATPMSVMVGVGKGAQNGVLIKNAESLESLSKVDTLIIDKTGTITEGKPSVGSVVAESGYESKELLQAIASLNQHSEHPLGSAIVRYANEKGTMLDEVTDFDSITGKGVIGFVQRQRITLGNKALLDDDNIVISDSLANAVAVQQHTGATVSYIAIDGKAAGYVTITDKIKETSKAAITALLQHNIDVIMLTGDNATTAKAVANELNLTSFKADFLPQDKRHEILRLQQNGKIVAMAGDGINDAPALAQANVGIAMGTGTDVAIESASITLVKGDLEGILKAINLSHRVITNIRQNLFFAFVYNIIGIPIAAGVLYPFFGILLSPMIAGAAMSVSSVSVIVNSLRLKNSSLS